MLGYFEVHEHQVRLECFARRGPMMIKLRTGHATLLLISLIKINLFEWYLIMVNINVRMKLTMIVVVYSFHLTYSWIPLFRFRSDKPELHPVLQNQSSLAFVQSDKEDPPKEQQTED